MSASATQGGHNKAIMDIRLSPVLPLVTHFQYRPYWRRLSLAGYG